MISLAERRGRYGFLLRFATSRNSGEHARSIAARILRRSFVTSITLDPRTRPRWRLPTFTTGRPNEAASISPLDELPTMVGTKRIIEKYACCPKLGTTHAFACA